MRWTASGGGRGRRSGTVIDETKQFVLDIDFHCGRFDIVLQGLYQLCDGEVDVKVHLGFRLLFLDDERLLFEREGGGRWRMWWFETSGRGDLIELLDKPFMSILFLVWFGSVRRRGRSGLVLIFIRLASCFCSANLTAWGRSSSERAEETGMRGGDYGRGKQVCDGDGFSGMTMTGTRTSGRE